MSAPVDTSAEAVRGGAALLRATMTQLVIAERLRMADLIEALAAENTVLRAALLRWQQYGCPDCGGDCGSANPPVPCCIMQETRAALAGNTP